MEKLDLSKLKLASSSLDEHIKTSGVKMGRTISSKMKEILQSPTPESKAVDEATVETLSDPNWGLNLRICAMIGRGDYDGNEIVRAIKEKLAVGQNPPVHGLRDSRVRLSVNTAIQFFDLQDRLGYDQSSKAVEWLLKAMATSIEELPPMNTQFPDTPKQLSDEKRASTGGSDQLGFDVAEVNLDNYSQQQVTKSSAACSSTSETSKQGLGALSLEI